MTHMFLVSASKNPLSHTIPHLKRRRENDSSNPSGRFADEGNNSLLLLQPSSHEHSSTSRSVNDPPVLFLITTARKYSLRFPLWHVVVITRFPPHLCQLSPSPPKQTLLELICCQRGTRTAVRFQLPSRKHHCGPSHSLAFLCFVSFLCKTCVSFITQTRWKSHENFQLIISRHIVNICVCSSGPINLINGPFFAVLI